MRLKHFFIHKAIGCLIIASIGQAFTVLLNQNSIKHSSIFNSSLDYIGCQYKLSPQYENSPLSIGENNGLVTISPFYKFENLIINPLKCIINIKNCENGYSMNLTISFALRGGTFDYSGDGISVKVALPKHFNHQWLPVLSCKEYNNSWLPSTLRKCSMKLELTDYEYWFRQHHNSIQLNTNKLDLNTLLNANLRFTCTSESDISCDNAVPFSLTIGYDKRIKSSRKIQRHRRAAPMRFSVTRYSVSVKEGLSKNTQVIALRVLNRGANCRFSWVAIRNKQSSSMFYLNETTGVVYTAIVLDREAIPRHLFRVTVSDSTNRQANCYLDISVADVNDNDPKFEFNTYSFDVAENENTEEQIGIVAASDKDIGENANIDISFIEKNHPFGIRDGLITVKSHIDREVKSKYSLTLIAKDAGLPQRNSTVSIVITVLDVNDNAPKFTQQKYHENVPENALQNSIVARVKASDPDEGENGQVRYSLLSRGNFVINRNTGEIRLTAPLDFESNAREFHLSVRAQDDGKPPQSSSCIVEITVQDKNDNKPRFDPPSYRKNVPENLKIRSVVLTVIAIDSDSATNSKLSYSIVGATNLPFTISKTNGDIILQQSLDYEQVRRYSFTVKATDSGGLYGEGFVNINVDNVNDNSPIFDKKVYSARVQENANLNDKIIDVIATDKDVDSTINYWISRGNEDNKFSLRKHGSVAILSLAGRLDYSVKETYALTVVASDGLNSNTATINVKVMDQNTHAPVFLEMDYDLRILENVKIGKILKVAATDDDEGENARITYAIEGGSRIFSINPSTGDISTKVLLDRERDSYYRLEVTATDNGVPKYTGRANVFITVKDVNDNAPKFDQKSYEEHVTENVDKGFRVIQLSASDIDFGDNRKIDYELVDDANGHFAIDRLSGVIRTQISPDRENIAEYTLVAKAVDRGSPPLFSTVNVHIIIEDVDDNPPQFASDHLYYSVPENTPIGKTVVKLEAHDPDAGGNAKIQYEQMPDMINLPVWELDYNSGELRSIKELDFEERSNYTIVVIASSAELVSQVTVHIMLVDVNDNVPVVQPFMIIFNNYRTLKHNTFPVGSIGKVPAYDPDVSSVLKYRFLDGNKDSLLLLNNTTGDIQLSRKLDTNREFTTSFQIEVSDGFYREKTTCTLKVVRIDDDMLANSITVRVHETAQEQFLSDDMDDFVQGLSQILNVSKQDIFIFNVNNDTDVLPHSVVNVSFSARHATGYFFTSQYLKEQVYLNRSHLSKYSMQNVLPFDDNICLREPCENYKRCVSALQFNGSASFITTNTVLFRPIHPIAGLRCKCPTGFVGVGCENEVNLCFPSPCKNGGECLSVEGGYRCTCVDGYTGENCEIDTIGGRCTTEVCRNSASCTEHLAGGFACDCSELKADGVDDFTSFCELRSRTFEKGNFIMFSGITNQWRFTLSLSFSTLEPNGLLLYNGRFNHQHDYFALEIVEGQVQLNFSTGQVSTVVSPYIHGGVNDGQWHTLLIQYKNKPNREINNNDDHGPSRVKEVTVTIDPETCDPALSKSWKDDFGEFTCSKTARQEGAKRSLDLTTPLLLGGVPDLPEAYQVRTRWYVGCMRELIIEHKMVDLMEYVANHDTKPGCSGMSDVCTRDKCYNNAECVSVLGTYKCQCNIGYAGNRCERQRDVVQIDGRDFLQYPRVTTLRQLNLPFTQSVGVQTTAPDGTILYLTTSTPLNMKIEIAMANKQLQYKVMYGRSQAPYSKLSSSVVNDGNLHQIQAKWTQQGRLIRVAVSVDDYKAMELNLSLSLVDLKRSKLQSLLVGGRENVRRQAENVLVGCVQGVEVVMGTVNHGVDMKSLVTKRGRRATVGCKVSNPCMSHKCPTQSKCIKNFDQSLCKCDKGYIGANCVSLCTALSPCSSHGQCMLNTTSQYGYTCKCQSNLYYGRTCESKHLQPCPPGWLGQPVCMPCNCPTEKNFDIDCESNGGQCVCKKNHYYNAEEDTCIPCKCYHLGSRMLNCTSSGQCACKPDVVGKTCSKCSNKFSQITDSGCVVVYDDKCPRSVNHGMLWLNTPFNELKPSKCPPGSLGIATRFCEETVGWHEPTLTNCSSNLYHSFLKDIDDLETNKTTLSAHYSSQIARRLRDAANETEEMYRSDVEISYKMMLRLINYQNQQQGFDLAAAQDDTFNDNLLYAMSDAFDTTNNDHWMSLHIKSRKRNVNSAKLLQSLEGYMDSLTSNMDEMFYTSINSNAHDIQMQITTNALIQTGDKIELDMSVNETLPIGELATIVYSPRVQDLHKPMPNETTSVGVLQSRTLGGVLPMLFFEGGRNMRVPKKPYVNSPVVMVVAYDSTNASRNMLYKGDLIEITFPLLRADQSSPQCVFWNFKTRLSDDVGGWSSKNCSKTRENISHVTCECSHLTTFAVITDEEVISAVTQLPVAIALYTSVAIVCGSVIALIVCYLALSDVKSNHAAIHVNYGAAVLFSEGFYVAGIQQSNNDTMCMAVAIFLHLFFMSIISWLFVEGLHLYRMIKEKRDINHGQMWVYYLFGWGFPALTTAISVGLNASGFGNTQFCWITVDDMLMWSFLGPMMLCIVMYILLFALSVQKYFSLKLKDEERKETRANLRTSFLLVPLSGLLWAVALYAVNENKPMLYFVFSIVNAVLGIMILLFHVILNKEMRTAFHNVKDRQWKHAEFNSTQQRLLNNTSVNHTLDGAPGNGMVRFNDCATNPSSTASVSVHLRNRLQNSSTFHNDSNTSDDLDSDSDSSGSSISLASTHSSDEEDEEISKDPHHRSYLHMGWNTRNGGHHPIIPSNGKLQVHSTPKEDQSSTQLQLTYSESAAYHENNRHTSPLPTVTESPSEENLAETEQDYLAITRSDSFMKKEDVKEFNETSKLIQMEEYNNSLPKKGILKNKPKPPPPKRNDSLHMNGDTTELIQKSSSPVAIEGQNQTSVC